MSQESGFGPFGGGNIPDTPTFGAPEIVQTASNPFDSASLPETPNGAVQTQLSNFNMTEMAQANSTPNTGFTFSQQPAQPAQPAAVAQPQQQPMQSPFNSAPQQPVFNQPSTQSPFLNNGPQQTNVNTFGTANNRFNNNNNQQQRYHIVDMCYLYNYTPNEVPLCVVAYNADFNNLRLSLNNIINIVPDHYLFVSKDNIPRLTSINLYSEFCYQILFTTNGTIPIIERTFTDNNNWGPNKTAITRNQDIIQIQTIDMNNNQYSFTINQPNTGMFLKCLEFMINGNAWSEFLRVKA